MQSSCALKTGMFISTSIVIGSGNDINENCQRSRFHYYYTTKELENKDTSETASPVSFLVINLNLTRIVNFQPETMTKDSTSPLPL
jgi:hypothetical protein